MNQATPWQPSISLENLRLRSEVLWKIRKFFHESDFLEVQTPILSRDTVVDRHIDPVTVAGSALGVGALREATFYLQTSPEFGMKRLLAAGAHRIYQIGSVFRAEERGDFHNPEFTMIEWYRTGDNLVQATEFLAQLLQAISANWQPTRSTYQHVFQQYVKICPLNCSLTEMAAAAVSLNLGVSVDWSNDRDDWLNLLFSEVVQPQLGKQHPEIVTHYPSSQSALARVSPQDVRVAERFELFVEGIELANGYHELLEADELASRNTTVNIQRARDGKPTLPHHSRLIEAMRDGLPACSGCALGLDRLLMVLSQSTQIDQVICFPIERA
jgi:elongation factor P--(R)-beta-lysine ligase